MKEIRNEAFEEYKLGAKIGDIAMKYGISVNTVKSWARRHWKMQKGAAVTLESNRRVQPRPHGAPKGNQNNLIHGAYRENRCDAIDDELMDDIDREPEEILRKLYVFYMLRELRIMKKQMELKRAYEEKGIDFHVKVICITRRWKGNKRERTVTRIPACYSLHMALERELTRISSAILEIVQIMYRVQRAKNKANRSTARKIYRMVETAEVVEGRISKVMGRIHEVYESGFKEC